MDAMTERQRIDESIVPNIVMFITQRDGAEVWESALIGQSRTMFLPVKDKDGKAECVKPHWSCQDKPTRVLTKLEEVEVSVTREVKRVKLALRMGSQGMSLKLTDGSKRKCEKAVDAATEWTCKKCNFRAPEKKFNWGYVAGTKALAGPECPSCANHDGALLVEHKAFYVFSNDSQEAIIMVEDRTVPLEEYVKEVRREGVEPGG